MKEFYNKFKNFIKKWIISKNLKNIIKFKFFIYIVIFLMSIILCLLYFFLFDFFNFIFFYIIFSILIFYYIFWEFTIPNKSYLDNFNPFNFSPLVNKDLFYKFIIFYLLLIIICIIIYIFCFLK
jgi:hypothetical protein